MNSTMRRTGIGSVAGIALCAFTAPAFALPPPPYAVVDLGSTQIGLESTGLEGSGIQTTGRDRRDTGFAITLGWRFSPQLAVEGTFLELGEAGFDVTVPNGTSTSNARIGVRSSGVLLALAGTWPVHERLSLEGRAGAYIGKNETRVRGTSQNPLGSQPFNSLLGSETKTGLAAGVGAVVALNDTWGLRAGYDYFDQAFGKDARRISLGVRFNWP